MAEVPFRSTVSYISICGPTRPHPFLFGALVEMNKAALFSLSALVAIACAAPTSDEEPVYGDGDGDATGSGGVAAGSGGFVLGSSGGSTATTSGGATAVGSGGTPGGTSGGAPSTTSGGAPPIGATCSATGWEANNGYADNGQMCGFAWTSGWDGATVDPPCGTGACFETQGAELCATAEIPAEVADTSYPGAMIGWNAAQNAEGGTNATWTASGTGLTATFTATGATGATRVVIQSGASDYCAEATSGVAIPWASFKTECWGATGSAFSAGMPVTAVAVQVNSAMAAQSVNLCVESIVVN